MSGPDAGNAEAIKAEEKLTTLAAFNRCENVLMLSSNNMFRSVLRLYTSHVIMESLTRLQRAGKFRKFSFLQYLTISTI